MDLTVELDVNKEKVPSIKGGILSKQTYYKLAETNDVPSIQKTSIDKIKYFNELMVKINQHPKYEGQKFTREVIAGRMGVKIGDLNMALQHNTPAASSGNLLKRTTLYLVNVLKNLDNKSHS